MLKTWEKGALEGVFLWGALSDKKVICDKFKLAKQWNRFGASKSISEREERNANRAVRIPPEEAGRLNGNVKMSASLSMA